MIELMFRARVLMFVLIDIALVVSILLMLTWIWESVVAIRATRR